ncbi:MAG: DUF692 domain-containing protein, partial [Pseudomonadota bacterium]|nr:DUF692 domain-containing protein [Pseudomonadota bacterium]
AGGAPHHYLSRLREDYPLSLHGVGLSLGGTDPLDEEHLKKTRRLIDRYQPGLVSEHLSWGAVGNRFLNDLLPLPYTVESLVILVSRIQQAQDILGRRLLVENPSTYLEFNHSTIPEPEFLAEIAQRADCGVLLDVNNVYVSAMNHGFDPKGYLRQVPADRVGEIHLAGHTVKELDDGRILIDTHNDLVCDDVWELYEFTIGLLGPRPTLIEWDVDLPEMRVLVDEAARAQSILEQCHAWAA